ncbi:thiamine phosphate synthase [Mobilitalea sibirica]|uniref:Thiamine-phosphate synthase n=1 Tax=Mobilitalea sibirica TaxID=1462919 RepID=A0A8J7H191_9FIRM|nr:thiamine phosphate synthase [Mobilitalea sibirica]MBH1939825.1 thiamine phosphate synthase [Mobilitalea sibirica]
MRIKKEDLLLYVVTDRSWLGTGNLYEQVESVIKAGATMVQLREKNLPKDEFIKEAMQMKKITSKYQIPLIINDNIDVTLASGADGVHLGQEDEQIALARAKLGADRIIGLSAHNVYEAMKAEEYGADYIGVGAVFGTTTKSDANHISMDTIKKIRGAVQLPMVAIGGITKENILQLNGSGVDGVAVISAIFAQPDPACAAREMIELSKTMVRSNHIFT